MVLLQTQALVLKTTAYRDKDIIVHLLTEEFGKKTGIFYGARSPRSNYNGMSEPFSQLGIEFSEKENADMITVRNADIQKNHVHLRTNYDYFLLASYFTELIHIAIIPDPEGKDYFLLLKNALVSLASKQSNSTKKLDFELRLLHLLGVFPQLRVCIICNKPILQIQQEGSFLEKKNHYSMDVTQGGIRCQNCFSRDSKSILLNPGSLMFLNRWYQIQSHSKDLIVLPTRQNLIEINPLIQAFFKMHLPRLPKAYALLEKNI